MLMLREGRCIQTSAKFPDEHEGGHGFGYLTKTIIVTFSFSFFFAVYFDVKGLAKCLNNRGSGIGSTGTTQIT